MVACTPAEYIFEPIRATDVGHWTSPLQTKPCRERERARESSAAAVAVAVAVLAVADWNFWCITAP